MAITDGKLIISVRVFHPRVYEITNLTSDGLADIALWSIVELGVGLSAGSAAALRPVLRLISTGSLLSSRQTKHSRNQFSTIEDTATMAGKDISLRVMVKGGKVSSAGDADSQNPILDEEGIFVRSEVNMGEEFVRRDAI